ncbi:hypothetical protein [Caulobacter sp. Root1455]|uniref:hypothetical protein n=1 Tax=Caulobacter sp. Root1455 TaxID=1736465 RepID=UPI000B1FC86B|nr:hypothetical protein [Caulobacter sp. Root1455]
MREDERQPWDALDHVEINYDAGRPMATFDYFFAKFSSNIKFFPQLPSVEGRVNGLLIGGVLLRYAARAEEHFRAAIARHKIEVRDGQVSKIVSRDDLESMIYFMRRSVDLLVQLYCLSFSEDKSAIEVDSIGRALTLKGAGRARNADMIAVLFGDVAGREPDRTNFLSILNGISNSYKHGFLISESDVFRAVEFPNIVLFEYKNNKFSNAAIVHNHNACHIMMGFQDAIRRILKNAGALPNAWAELQSAG